MCDVILPQLACSLIDAKTSKNIDCVTVHTACLVFFISAVNGHCNKKRKEKKKLTLGRPALVGGTQQTLRNLF
jgi:hypothetical protein